jgi:hypothetical protein
MLCDEKRDEQNNWLLDAENERKWDSGGTSSFFSPAGQSSVAYEYDASGRRILTTVWSANALKMISDRANIKDRAFKLSGFYCLKFSK